MAAPLIAASVGLTAVSMISGFLGSKKASKAAKKQAAEEARIEGLLTTERMRQLDKEEDTAYGQTLAAYAGSGVKATAGAGTPQQILAEQKEEFGYERQITQDVGASKDAQSLQQGRAADNAYRYQGYANLASGLASMFGQVADYKMYKAGNTGP